MELLKHQWSDYERCVLIAFKQLCRNGKNIHFTIDMDSMFAMQKMMVEALRDRNRESRFFHHWERFGVSGFSGRSSNETTVVENAFSQCAAAVLLKSSVLTDQERNNLHDLINMIFTFHGVRISEQKIFLRDRAILEAAERHDIAKVKLLSDLSRNRDVKLKYTYLMLLNSRAYDDLMQIHEVCGGLEKTDIEILLRHFYYPAGGEGKRKFNDFFMEHCPGVINKEFWAGHRENRNLEKILMPALERGVSPHFNVLSCGAEVNCSLHRYLLFIDELADILSCKDLSRVFSLLKQDIVCAAIYLKWLEKQKKETLND
ncbi:MAG: hypothetical protein J6S54_06740 [Lentisphaeria bacterium]|nr:hypothetical protein [Lentisphaeria bacterium]